MKPSNSGYICLHRKITSHPLYLSEKFTKVQAWIDLILLANHKKSHYFARGIKVDVGRGQLAYSQERLAQRWLWTRGSVIRFLRYLESEHQIVQQKTAITNLISIVNYNRYQPNSTTKSTTNGTGDSTTVDTHSKKYNNVNKRGGQFAVATAPRLKTIDEL